MRTINNRREFLKQSTKLVTVSAATAALGGVHSLAADKPQEVRLGIVGIMSAHVKGLVARKETVSLAWLCDVDPRQSETIAGFMHQFSRMGRDSNNCENLRENCMIRHQASQNPSQFHRRATRKELVRVLRRLAR